MQATEAARASANREAWQALLLRLGGTGLIAAGRNILYADHNAVFQVTQKQTALSFLFALLVLWIV